MKFHHDQKVNIREGYYKTFQGTIKDVKIDAEGNYSYLVRLLPKKNALEQKPLDKWFKEKELKPTMW